MKGSLPVAGLLRCALAPSGGVLRELHGFTEAVERMTISPSSAQDAAASAAMLIQINAPLPGHILVQEKKRCV